MTRLWLIALTLWALCGSLAAQSTARIEGRVVSQSGEPVRKATVRLQSLGSSASAGQPASYLEVTDNAGKFSIEGIAPDRYRVSASRPGFSVTQSNGPVPGPIVTLQAGDSKTDVEVKLIQLAIISGQITDRDGEPVFGAQVYAMRFQYNSRRQLTIFHQASSDDQGNFRILNVQPGRYYLRADDLRARAYENVADRRGRNAQEVDIGTFYPGATDVSGAVAIDVVAGAEVRGVNIRMGKARLFTIRGKAVDGRTRAPTGVQLSLTLTDNSINLPDSRFTAVAQAATGVFEFHGVGAGNYVVQGEPGNPNPNVAAYRPPSVAGRMEVAVSNSDIDGLVFTGSPPLEITGTVHVEEGDLQSVFRPPVAAAGGRGGGIASSTVRLANSEDISGLNPTRAVVEADGTFKIQNVGWSRYSVFVSPLSDGSYIKSMRFGGQDLLKAPLDLTSGVGGVLEILLSPKAAEVDATVRNKNGDVASGVTVTMWSKTPIAVDPFNGRVLRSGPDGNVRLTGVPPGEYYVAAWEEVDTGLTQYPDFLARFTSDATLVKVGESDKATVDLTLIPKDKIAAEVAKLP